MVVFRWLYRGLIYLLLPLALAKLLWRARKDKAYLEHWDERFGAVRVLSKNVIWIHAVSVGETIAIQSLVEALLQKYPTYKIYLTNGTITGRARAMALFGDRVQHAYAPYDTLWFTRRFLKALKPKLVLIMETEVWPNWMAELKQQNIPVILVNARLSERSLRRYQRFRFLFKAAWQSFTNIAAQASPDAKRMEALGVDPSKIKITGNLKYNLTLPMDLQNHVNQWKTLFPKAPVWITASSHPGEEEILLSIYQQLKVHHPSLVWILVPRHTDRAEGIARLVTQTGYTVCLRSQIKENAQEKIAADILLVDTIGELLLFYSLAQVAFVGGSLIAHGGHNILEAAAVGVAITCGPHMFNFSTIVKQFEEASAVMLCQNTDELLKATLELFDNASLREGYVARAKACFEDEQHALENHLEMIEAVIARNMP